MAIQWLVDAGLTYRISRVREVGMPLKFYEDLNAFKLFLLDVGLLGALSEMEPAQMLISNKAMTESKGGVHGKLRPYSAIMSTGHLHLLL